MKVTIKTVEQIIHPKIQNLKANPDIYEAIYSTFQLLDQENDYNSKFGKSTIFFSNANWRDIAKDISDAINAK
jgi:hypothetical protein